MIETKDKAREILEYCVRYLLQKYDYHSWEKNNKKLSKEMIDEIKFMIDTN